MDTQAAESDDKAPQWAEVHFHDDRDMQSDWSVGDIAD